MLNEQQLKNAILAHCKNIEIGDNMHSPTCSMLNGKLCKPGLLHSKNIVVGSLKIELPISTDIFNAEIPVYFHFLEITNKSEETIQIKCTFTEQ